MSKKSTSQVLVGIAALCGIFLTVLIHIILGIAGIWCVGKTFDFMMGTRLTPALFFVTIVGGIFAQLLPLINGRKNIKEAMTSGDLFFFESGDKSFTYALLRKRMSEWVARVTMQEQWLWFGAYYVLTLCIGAAYVWLAERIIPQTTADLLLLVNYHGSATGFAFWALVILVPLMVVKNTINAILMASISVTLSVIFRQEDTQPPRTEHETAA